MALGIRAVVEKWHAGDAGLPGSIQTSDRARQTSRASTGIPASYSELGVIEDSGAAVLLADQYFESDSVTEQENGRVEVRIAPLSTEDDAALRSLKSERPFHASEVSFAHGNHGFRAQVNSARNESTSGRGIWVVELESLANDWQGFFDDVSMNKITPDQIATARARLLLLGEQPAGQLKDAEMLIAGAVDRRGAQRTLGAIFPEIWQRSSGDVVKFLRWARRVAVFALKNTNTCQHILKLSLSLESDARLAVDFTGRRQNHYANESSTISVAGTCELKTSLSKTAHRR